MSEKNTTFEHFYHEYAGKHKDALDNDLLMAVIERAFYAGAMGGVGTVANRISELEGAKDPSDVIMNISDVIKKASTELMIVNERLNGEVGTA
jgi:hypothetical protein